MRDNERPTPVRSRSSSNSSKENIKKKYSESERSKSSPSKSRSRSRSPTSTSSEREDEYRLHIADIGDNARKSELERVFSQYGNLKEFWMTNSTPCFGFAVFKTKESANAALKAADGTNVAGSRIRVTHARPRTRGQGRRFFHPNMRCYQCGYSGHFYRDCPDLNDGEKKNPPRYDSYHDRSRRRRRDREYYPERDYDRRRHRSSRRYDDYSSHRSNRRRRY